MAYVVKVVETQAADAETTVGAAFAVSWDDRLNEVGFGTVSMPSDDTAAVKARVPLNEIRVYESDGTTLRWAFVIEQIDTTVVGPEEGGSKVLTVSGPGMGSRLSRAIVYPEYGLTKPFGQTRLFGFMTPDMNGPNEGGVVVTSYGTQANPDTEIAGSLAGFPVDWPDPSAEWLTSSALVGTGTTGDPYRFDSGDLDGNSNPDGSGTFYMRREFTTTEDFGRCRIFAAIDSYGTVFFDGVPVIDTLDPTNYTSGLTADVDIPAGAHCIAIRVTNRPALNDDANNFALALLTILQLDGDGLNPNNVLYRTFASPTTAGWQAFDPPTVPGLNAGQVMNILLAESDARSVGTVDAVDYDETTATNGDEVSATDTAGDDWTTTVNNFGWTVGTDYLTVLQGLQDLCGVDWYVSPDRTLSMWQNGRGTDRGGTPDSGVTTVELAVGDDLLDWRVETDAPRTNTSLVRSQQAVAEATDPVSVGVYSRVESLFDLGTVGVGTSEAGAAVTSRWLKTAEPAVTAVGRIHGDSGAAPYTNFDVGDVVTAPGADGTGQDMRIVAVTGEQDDASGTVLWGVEAVEPRGVAVPVLRQAWVGADVGGLEATPNVDGNHDWFDVTIGGASGVVQPSVGDVMVMTFHGDNYSAFGGNYDGVTPAGWTTLWHTNFDGKNATLSGIYRVATQDDVDGVTYTIAVKCNTTPTQFEFFSGGYGLGVIADVTVAGTVLAAPGDEGPPYDNIVGTSPAAGSRSLLVWAAGNRFIGGSVTPTASFDGAVTQLASLVQVGNHRVLGGYVDPSTATTITPSGGNEFGRHYAAFLPVVRRSS